MTILDNNGCISVVRLCHMKNFANHHLSLRVATAALVFHFFLETSTIIKSVISNNQCVFSVINVLVHISKIFMGLIAVRKTVRHRAVII